MVIGEGGPPRGVFFFESLGPGWDSGQLMYFSWSRFTLFKMVCVHLPCISVCIGCGYMVVLSHNITRMSTSIQVACGTSRALVGSNLLGCGHMKCFVSNCNGKIEMKVSYLELYSSTASSLLCSCRYVLFSSQIKFPFCLAPKFTLPEISTPEKNRWLEDD